MRGEDAVFRDQLFLVGRRLLMANQGKLPETKYSLGGLPRCSRDSWGEGTGQRATSAWQKNHSILLSVVWGLVPCSSATKA